VSQPTAGPTTTARQRATINTIALATWPGGTLVLALHVAHLAFTNDQVFSVTAIWLLGIGCCGCPAFALRVLGHWTTPRVCAYIAAAFGGSALMLTLLAAIGYIHPAPADLIIGLIILLAFAIQAFNAADALGTIARLRADYTAALDRARTQHRETCILASDARQRRVTELIDAVATLDHADTARLADAVEQRLAADDTALRLVVPAQPRSTNGQP
jgi:hypothetical protein